MKLNLLIAEDDAELCYAYQRFFMQRGFEVETAADGLDCQAKLLRRTPAAVVLDLGLRWGGGEGVLSWLREERTLADVPVILTATAGYSAAAETRPPVVTLLTKPFALTVLLENVQAAITGTWRAEGSSPTGGVVGPELFIG